MEKKKYLFDKVFEGADLGSLNLSSWQTIRFISVGTPVAVLLVLAFNKPDVENQQPLKRAVTGLEAASVVGDIQAQETGPVSDSLLKN